MAAPNYRDTILTTAEPETERLFHGDDESDSDPEPGDRAKSSPKYQPIRRFLVLLWKSCVCLLALYGLLGLWQVAHNRLALVKQDATCSCGTSVAEATAMGCQYDVLSSAWLPPRCRDEEISTEFDKAGPGGAWSYFEDANGTIPIDLSALGQLTNTGRSYYATNTWHLVHCFYFWKKQYRVRFTGVTVEGWGDTEPHIDHCLKMFHSFAWTESIGSMHAPMLPNPLERNNIAGESKA